MAEKKYYFCEELNSTLTLMNGRVTTCCSGRNGPAYWEEYKKEPITKEFILRKKEEFYQLLNDEDIEKTPCKDCFYLRERKEDDVISDKFKLINISHWTQCNCGCFYCARMWLTHGKITKRPEKSEFYDFLPFLKQLYKEDLLDRENLTACFQGGDISILKEFEPCVKEFLKQGIKEFTILTNNIRYQPIVKKLLDMDKVWFNVSIDSGCRETYKKIKRVDKFNDVINNLKKYAKTNNKHRLSAKFILLDHMNDNKEEIEKFISLMANIGVPHVEFMIDYKWLFFTDLEQKPLPSHYGELYQYFKQLCDEKGMRFGTWPLAEEFMKKHTGI